MLGDWEVLVHNCASPGLAQEGHGGRQSPRAQTWGIDLFQSSGLGFLQWDKKEDPGFSQTQATEQKSNSIAFPGDKKSTVYGEILLGLGPAANISPTELWDIVSFCQVPCCDLEWAQPSALCQDRLQASAGVVSCTPVKGCAQPARCGKLLSL